MFVKKNINKTGSLNWVVYFNHGLFLCWTTNTDAVFDLLDEKKWSWFSNLNTLFLVCFARTFTWLIGISQLLLRITHLLTYFCYRMRCENLEIVLLRNVAKKQSTINELRNINYNNSSVILLLIILIEQSEAWNAIWNSMFWLFRNCLLMPKRFGCMQWQNENRRSSGLISKVRCVSVRLCEARTNLSNRWKYHNLFPLLRFSLYCVEIESDRIKKRHYSDLLNIN